VPRPARRQGARRGAEQLCRAAGGPAERPPGSGEHRGRAPRGTSRPCAAAPIAAQRDQRRGAASQRQGECDTDAHHEQHAEPAHHRHGREQQHEEARGRRERRRRDRRHRDPRRPRGRPRARRIGDPSLVLDRVVDPQPEQHRQHRDRRHRQRRADQRHQPERQRHRTERHGQRHQPQPAAEHEREHGRHDDQRHQQEPRDRAGERVGEVLRQHRHARDRVAVRVAQGELRHPHRRAHQLGRALALGVAQARLQPHLDRRRLGRREQVGEARLRGRHAALRVEHERRDEVGVVEPRGLVDAEPVLQVELEQVAHELRVDELLGRARQPLLLGLRLALPARHLARRRGRPLGLRTLRVEPRA
jgi:hypothetical protein